MKKTKTIYDSIMAVEWNDHCSPIGNEWTDMDEARERCGNLHRCFTVGFLVKETKDTITLAMSLDDIKEPSQGSNFMVIARNLITKVTKFKNV